MFQYDFWNWMALFFNWAVITGAIYLYTSHKRKLRENSRLSRAGQLNWACHMARLNRGNE